MTGAVRRELGLLAHAIGFLTRVPVPQPLAHAPELLGQSARWFPAVGLLVGLGAGAVWWGASALGLPPLAAAALGIAAGIWATGGLHEDGLADTADGLGGGATAERALQIMRDSRIGTYGALALGLSLILRIACLAALTPGGGVAALLLAHAAGRAGMVISLLTLPYARAEGLASGAKPAQRGATATIALATAAGTALFLAPLPGLVALAAGALVWAGISHRLYRRIGGYTGDGLGATEQGIEIAVLLTLAAAWA